MGLADDLEADQKQVKLGAPSSWNKLMAALGDDAEELKQHLIEDRFSSAAIARILTTKYGFEISNSSVSNYRNRLRNGRL